MTKYDTYITFIFIIKVGFILMAITHLYLKVKGKDKTALDKQIMYLKDRFEFVFIVATALLLMYLFNPHRNRTALIDHETCILLYLFGVVLIITSKWDIFVKESAFVKQLQQIIGNAGSR